MDRKSIFMEFNEKLQELRKQKGLTQEELAQVLFVSRAAISKWESGRGYPNIDSLKAIANYFTITVDELLSSDELLTLAKADTQQKEMHYRDLTFGLLDCGIVMFLFLPFFGEKTQAAVQSVSLISLSGISPWLKAIYYSIVIATILCGISILALQNCEKTFWLRSKIKLSLTLNTAGVFLFIVSLQAYAAAFLFLFLMIKVLMLRKTP